MYILVADPHLGVSKDSELWHDVTIKLFQTIADYCLKKSIKDVVVLGDFFHDRKQLNIKTLDVALQIANVLKGLNVYLIVGNHDTFHKDRIEPTSLELFQEHRNITIVESPLEMDNMILVPWGIKPERSWSKFDVVLGHFEINGFPANDNYIYQGSTLNPDDFAMCNLVLSGHFHTPSKIDNIIYLGSPYQMSFGDSEVPRGFFCYGNSKLELVEFTDAPKFIKLYSGEKPVRERIEDNIVRLIYTRDYGKIQNNKILEAVQLMKPLQLHTDFTKISNITSEERTEEEHTQIKSNREILEEYLQKVKHPDHIKLSTLIAMIDKLVLEGKE